MCILTNATELYSVHINPTNAEKDKSWTFNPII